MNRTKAALDRLGIDLSRGGLAVDAIANLVHKPTQFGQLLAAMLKDATDGVDLESESAECASQVDAIVADVELNTKRIDALEMALGAKNQKKRGK